MVDIKTTRDIRIDGDNYIAIKKDEYINGVGKKVVRILEEHNITVEEIDEIINNLAIEEMKKVEEEKNKLIKEIDEMTAEILDISVSEKYVKFKEMVDNDESKILFETLKKESAIKSADKRLNELDNVLLDIIAWKDQFIKLKDNVK